MNLIENDSFSIITANNTSSDEDLYIFLRFIQNFESPPHNLLQNIKNSLRMGLTRNPNRAILPKIASMLGL